MPLDPYANDTCYVRFHLARLVIDKLSQTAVNTTEEAVSMLEGLAAFIRNGKTMDMLEHDQEMDEPEEAVIVNARESSPYI